nr:AAA family ATPase [uncultured Moraxella sp.]
MKIKQLHLQNYGRFEDLTINFAPTDDRASNVTVIVGNNGAGKSQILQALATGLSWFISGLQNKVPSGNFINSNEIRNGKDISILNIKGEINKNLQSINNNIKNLDIYLKSNRQRDDEKFASLGGLEIIDFTENVKKDEISLPIITFYPVERSILTQNIILDSSAKNLRQFVGYNLALTDGIDFNSFIEWFRLKEDIENAQIRKEVDKLIESLVRENNDNNRSIIVAHLAGLTAKERVLEKNTDNQLQSVKSAISYFLDTIENVWIDRSLQPPVMMVEKDGKDLNINQLSQGEKSLLALVGDVARRLAILNPSLDDPLQGEGVVMIDEVDLHLHPRWQHNLIDKLVRTFPNVQFILTTHSPLIVSDRADILVYLLDDGNLRSMDNVYGEDANTLLNDIFYVPPRTPEVEETFNAIRRAISNKELDNADEQIQQIAKRLSPSNNELLKLRLMLAHAKLANNTAG